METFLRAFLVVGGGLLLSALPVCIIALRQEKSATAYRFAVSALVIGGFFGIASIVSERLIDGCSRSGSIACLDVGYQGLLFLIAILYVVVAVIRAVVLWRS